MRQGASRLIEGVVVRAVSGFYDVAPDAGDIWLRCRARGVFRNRGTTVLVGDRVDVESADPGEGIITCVHRRTTQLLRPPVANVDQAILASSLSSPAFQPLFLDRLLITVQQSGLLPVIVLTKTDLASPVALDAVRSTYAATGFPLLCVSLIDQAGMEQLRQRLTGKVSVLAGLSGVGKSSLANHLAPDLGARMGNVSDRVGRGRHTTRHVELFRLWPQTWMVDTPGFSHLDLHTPAADLRTYFPEFSRFAVNCGYRSCLHDREQGCAVLDAVADGDIAASRHRSYRTLLHEVQEQEAHRY